MHIKRFTGGVVCAAYQLQARLAKLGEYLLVTASDLLEGYTDVALEVNRVRNMVTVESVQ